MTWKDKIMRFVKYLDGLRLKDLGYLCSGWWEGIVRYVVLFVHWHPKLMNAHR